MAIVIEYIHASMYIRFSARDLGRGRNSQETYLAISMLYFMNARIIVATIL